MYDPEVAFVRQIERYQATARSNATWDQVRLYLVNYEESVEEQRYRFSTVIAM